MKQLPKKLKIGGHLYTIVEVKENDFASSPCGRMSRNTNEIQISSSLTKSNKEVTLFHEIIHAINGELSEAMVDSLAEQLYQVFAENRLLK